MLWPLLHHAISGASARFNWPNVMQTESRRCYYAPIDPPPPNAPQEVLWPGRGAIEARVEPSSASSLRGFGTLQKFGPFDVLASNMKLLTVDLTGSGQQNVPGNLILPGGSVAHVPAANAPACATLFPVQVSSNLSSGLYAL